MTWLSPIFLQMTIQLHMIQHVQIKHNGDLFEPFPITSDEKQGCVLATTLFSIFLSIMLKQASDDLDDEDGMYVNFRLDGSFFNLLRLQGHTKTQERLISDLFADNTSILTHTEQTLQCGTSPDDKSFYPTSPMAMLN